MQDELDVTYPVDTVFTDFYAALGGQAALGPAITPLLTSGNIRSQYVEAGLMLYDPQAPESERHRLAPLGIVLGVSEPPVPDPEDPSLRYLNGHIIYPEFEPFYDQLGGAQYVGRPLTEARHNPDKMRIEQYFENLGFYRLDQDEPGNVRLIAYGASACGQSCRYQPQSSGIPSPRAFLEEPFAGKASRLGIAVLGRTLTDAHLAEDDRLEVIFENMVLVTEPVVPAAEPKPLDYFLWLPLALLQGAQERIAEHVPITVYIWLPLIYRGGQESAESVTLRPIVRMLRIEGDPPVSRGEDDPLMRFYPVDGERGYYIPLHFYDWIIRHGGFEVSGAPIGHVKPLAGGEFRQCFTNLCLDFDTDETEGEALRPAALGIEYKERFYDANPETPKAESLDSLEMLVWESEPFVGPDKAQEIHVAVRQDGEPLENREPVLTLTFPDGSRQVYRMRPTDENGVTFLRVEPIEVPTGTLIAYEVCLTNLEGERLCVQDHYVVWGRTE